MDPDIPLFQRIMNLVIYKFIIRNLVNSWSKLFAIVSWILNNSMYILYIHPMYIYIFSLYMYLLLSNIYIRCFEQIQLGLEESIVKEGKFF